MKLLKTCMVVYLSTLSFTSFGDVAVIVNPSNTSEISENDISRIFLGKNKSYANGNSVEPVNTKYGNGVRKEFEDKLIGKNKSQMKAYWSKLIFTGKGKPPKELSSDDEIIAFVATNPNAIGYISSEKVNDSVKVIK
ncbi:phosphate ABC transporter substrate-binding protein [Thalassotalea sp. 1_MG-2023]|uniref:phosphate ABC transporter substrate-binding protein n=1 Tax=Thalassotalea sp. 1_MG-2023 TaxID=3062680 RepID=UPI0026E13AA1|nr:phosphate ABC transporter substrate-binding protein [Thalassotalea sp. 1_MG-2023]MDO6427596.1 phosphate ABC transporter substrate-binding protein [Thalassotalea sp. 1_MG-2023]